MRRYETIFIVDPELSEEGRDPVLSRTKDLISEYEGFLVSVDEWGARKLAYHIKNKARGYYIRLDYCGDGALVNEIERSFRIDDRILKYMTVLLDKDADLNQIKEELEKAAAEKERVAQEQAERDRAARAAQEAAESAAEEQEAEDTPEEASAPDSIPETPEDPSKPLPSENVIEEN